MTNREKLNCITAWLRMQHIGYVYRTKHEHGKSDVFIPKYKVFIKIAGKDDAEFFLRHRTFPVFIREEESAEFVLEKVQMTIIKSMTRRQAVLLRKAKKEETKSKKHDKSKNRDRLRQVPSQRNGGNQPRRRKGVY